MGRIIFGHSIKYWIRYILILLVLTVAFDRLQTLLLKDA